MFISYDNERCGPCFSIILTLMIMKIRRVYLLLLLLLPLSFSNLQLQNNLLPYCLVQLLVFLSYHFVILLFYFVVLLFYLADYSFHFTDFPWSNNTMYTKLILFPPQNSYYQAHEGQFEAIKCVGRFFEALFLSSFYNYQGSQLREL